MLKRLSESTGEVIDSKPASGDSDSKVVRPAILVHSGPDGKGVTYMSGDGETKPFDAKRIQNIVKIHNAKLAKLAAEYGGEDKIPLGAFDPILDQHEGDSNDRIRGRLAHKLRYEVRDVPKVGKNVSCAVTDVTFLGKDTVDRVNDGRIYHLSIGIDENDDTLGETSTVINPAAPGAMLLKRGSGGKTENNGGTKMSDKNKSVETRVKRLTKLNEMRAELTKLTTANKTSKDLMRLTARKNEITGRLKQLCASGKMTPAEYKTLVKEEDLKHLASLDDKTLGIALKPYEAREKPVIQVGQRGTSDAVNFSTLTDGMKKDQIKRLKGEIRADFKRLTGKKMASADDVEEGHESHLAGGNKLDPVNPGKDEHAVPGQAGDEQQLRHMWGKHCEELKKHLDAGDIEGAKAAHKKMEDLGREHGMKHMAEYGTDVKSEDYKKGMDELQRQVDEQQTQMARLSSMLEELMSVEKEEGHDLEAGEPAPKEEPQQAAAAS